MMDARQFGQATVRCEMYDGVTDYRARHLRQPLPATPSAAPSVGANGDDVAGGRESVEEQEKKLDEFGDWLEAGSTDSELDADGEE
jgi:hypothetical protein